MMKNNTTRQIRTLASRLDEFEGHYVISNRVYGDTGWYAQDLGPVPPQLQDLRAEVEGTNDTLARRIDAGLEGDTDALVEALYRLLDFMAK